MSTKWFWYAGIGAVVMYIFATIYGGYLYPNYSHISQDISQLTSTKSPIRDLMNPIFLFYNLLVIGFGIGLYKFDKNNLSRLASVFIIVIGVLGAIVLLFPINTRGTSITFVGIMHIVLISIISLLSISANLLFWTTYKKSNFRLMAKISLVAGIAFLVAGPIAATNVTSPYAGLFERITIGIFLLWIVTISCFQIWKSNQK